MSICLFASCSSVSVVADYDSKTDFTIFKTFAFYKKGIDKAKISDLDKRRILKGIKEVRKPRYAGKYFCEI